MTDASAANGYRYILYHDLNALFSTDYSPCQPVWVLRSAGKGLELFERATVVEDGADRVKVEYPLKSTYNVPKDHLIPVINWLEPTILVCCETNLYRRASEVHSAWRTSVFVEIGCDYGITCERVQKRYPSMKVVGVDKSVESIRIAQERQQADTSGRTRTIEYIREDILAPNDSDILKLLPEDDLVVALDINGNRELEAVESSLERILECWKPRLIICKSRALHNQLMGQGDRPRNWKETENNR